ncbi:ABC transporter substrate-binding protein [Wenxinia marina]|uniref:Amino acid/amide ABC transporter substrate-binding protein, HAAT family n=1 Tax=Wenxinia marina DSM 24838 TaxID=1123501 RepID=A0A0D0QA22_9RHOB|nr:ABC transporter substrate-binding protein [Wenxinia marina]KIQ71294.1 amino acid/amide ABC transporter substrate-binding protein, HAAT family [Wenxinia marina DSM 24838]GGL73649.1 ABC transporter permease [Wenxinia marina]
MKTKTLAAAAAASLLATSALADLVIPDLSYRTGPYAAGGIPFSDGYQDYFELLNQRDGGIGGEPIRVIECETAYDTERGVECYESTKGEGALVYQPLSTGITYQLIPKTAEDGIPMHTMGYGRTSAANGAVFHNIFNYPANYWDGASVIVNYLLDQNEGSLDGKRIALVYHNSAYGKEPIPTLTQLSQDLGFELIEIPVDHPGQEQSSQWLQIRRERPDYVVMYGWGVMNQVAIQEAANIRYPMDQFIGIWWSGAEHDVTPAGAAADGYLAASFTGLDDFPVLDEIQELVIDAGHGAGDGQSIGNVQYIRGMYAAMLAAEAIRTAQELSGNTDITAAEMRDGMEALEVTNATMEAWGAPGIGPEFSVSCQNHGGPGRGLIVRWNASEGSFEPVSDWIDADRAGVIDPLIVSDSEAYAAEAGIEAGCE